MKCAIYNVGSLAPARSFEDKDSVPLKSRLVKFLDKESEQIKLC